MAYDPFAPIGQQVMASSQGVVIASNQSPVSVTGTVSVGNFPLSAGSVVAFQGTTPWVTSQNGSIATVIIGGSVAAMFTPPANQSVSGTVQAQLQSTNASVITVGSPVANQSVSGTVGASLIGLSPVSVSNFPVTQNVSGSVVAFVSGLQGASVSGTVNVGSLPTSATASVYAVLSSVTSVSILSANIARRGATLYNNAGTTVFVELGTPVSTSVFTVKMVDQSYYEVPYGWTGVVAGISTSNAGVITVSELT